MQTKILRSSFYENETNTFEIADYMDSDHDAENSVLNLILNELQWIAITDNDLRKSYVSLIQHHDKNKESNKESDVSSIGSGFQMRKESLRLSLRQDPQFKEFLTLVLHKLLSDSMDKNTDVHTLNQTAQNSAIGPKDMDLVELVDMIPDRKDINVSTFNQTAPALREMSE